MLDRYLLSKLISKLLSFAIFIDFFYAFMAYNSKNFLCLFSFLLCTNDNIRRFIDMISFGCVLVVVVVLRHLFYSYDAQTKIRKNCGHTGRKAFGNHCIFTYHHRVKFNANEYFHHFLISVAVLEHRVMVFCVPPFGPFVLIIKAATL